MVALARTGLLTAHQVRKGRATSCRDGQHGTITLRTRLGTEYAVYAISGRTVSPNGLNGLEEASTTSWDSSKLASPLI